MPTYEYTCKSCGDTIEVFQSFSDKPLRTHATCGGDLKKVFHARGVVFKGSGFYRTDSRSSKSGAAKGEPAGKGATGTKKSDSQSDKTSAVTSAAD